jgi:hypothetical protein
MTKYRLSELTKFVVCLCLMVSLASVSSGMDKMLLCSGTDGHLALERTAGPAHDHHDTRRSEDDPRSSDLLTTPDGDCFHLAVSASLLQARGSSVRRGNVHQAGGPLPLVSVQNHVANANHRLGARPFLSADHPLEQTLRSVRSIVLLI